MNACKNINSFIIDRQSEEKFSMAIKGIKNAA
jgi:hypothetical protein